MPRQAALTAKQVDAVEAHGIHFVGPSLYLQVRPQGTRSWLFRYKRAGRNYWYGLGPVADVGLKVARDEAERLRVAVRQGNHPVAERQAAKAAEKAAKPKVVPTFRECARSYIAAHQDGWKNDKHAIQWPNTMRDYVYPMFGDRPVDQVEVPDVVKVLQPIWTTKQETASRVRARMASIFGWATAMGYRSGPNPAAWQGGALPHLLPPNKKSVRVEHHKALGYSDVPAFVTDLQANGSLSAKALLFTILTCARTGETIGAPWVEIDQVESVWTVPAERMKAKRDHRVPLSAAVAALVESLPRNGATVFANEKGRPLSNMAMLMLLRGLRPDGATVHGFRSAFRDWAAERTDHPREVVEACLAHASGDAVELAYKRTDFFAKRRQVMADWADFCMGQGN